MANKVIHSRVTLKRDTKANWDKATSFVPLVGEPIVYTDGAGGEAFPRVKIGDGSTTVVNLPFEANSTSAITHTPGTAVGSSTQPVYIASNGAVTATGYSVAKSVPADAKFTDTVYTHPAGSAASKTSGLYKFSTDSTSHIASATAVEKADITGLGIPAQDTNQTVKGNGTAFDANAAINIAPGSNITITPNTSTNTITIASSYTDTDTKVTQTVASDNANYPILTKASSATTTVTDTSKFAAAVTVNPSTGNLNTTKINGVDVGNSPKFTDTITTASTTGSGNAVTSITASNGALTVTKGTTFLTSSQKGAASGVAELDSTGKVPSSQLPAFVDDVIEGYYYNGKFYSDSAHTQEITPESGKIYVDLSTNKTYRWSGSAYIEISASLALGETSTTAYRGDRGKIAYDHSQTAHVSTTHTHTTGTPSATQSVVTGVTSAGATPTLGTAIPADDITAWSAGSWTATPSETSSGSGVYNLTLAFTAPSLSYSAKSIPNVTSVGSMPTFSTGSAASSTHTHTTGGPQ